MNEILREAIREFGGVISTRQVQDLNISRQTLTNYVRSGKIERVGSGIYILPDTIEDDMYAFLATMPGRFEFVFTPKHGS